MWRGGRGGRQPAPGGGGGRRRASVSSTRPGCPERDLVASGVAATLAVRRPAVVATQNAPVPHPRSGRHRTERHEHPWPQSPSAWDELSNCDRCGIKLLRLFRYSADWVVRRVENGSCVDDSTVRRFVSVDYEPPGDALTFRCPDGEAVRLLPLAILRRKSLVNFDFRDHDGTALPLIGLRQNQALTL